MRAGGQEWKWQLRGTAESIKGGKKHRGLWQQLLQYQNCRVSVQQGSYGHCVAGTEQLYDHAGKLLGQEHNTSLLIAA